MFMMELNVFAVSLIFLISTMVEGSSWNNLNCPAPRAPDNGLSFIFRNGELVHFKCHPGYFMQGKAVSYCVNNSWTQATPKCVPLRKMESTLDGINDAAKKSKSVHYNLPRKDSSQKDKQRALFSWGTVYGDGPRRLPLINGIWPPQEQVEEVLALKPLSTPAPKALIKEEVDIAELRNRQLEELKKQRYFTEEAIGKRRHMHKSYNDKLNYNVDNPMPRETILSLGNTEDGDAFSVAYAKPNSVIHSSHIPHKHRHRHRKHKKHHHSRKDSYIPENVTSRKSRVDSSGVSPYASGLDNNFMKRKALITDVSEFKHKPIEQVYRDRDKSSRFSTYDETCTERIFRRVVPKIAPQSPNAFVYSYETKKNKDYPFNTFMMVKYRCNNGYVFADGSERNLFCKNSAWVSETPRCVKQT